MTTPNLPWATTSVDDLPQGVFAPSELGSTLQDHTQSKYTDLASSRFPGIAKGTSAGSPSNVGGPLGFVVNQFARITSKVATADPATVTKPDDIVAQAGGLFSGLPLVSLVGDIAQAITGAIGGGIATIKSFFDDLLGGALQGINPFSVFSRITSIFFHQSAVENTASTASTQATAAIAAATQANNTVLALVTGGTRTIYTSNFTYTKPSNLVKLGVIVMGGGGGGPGSQFSNSTRFARGGSYLYLELPASAVPATVAGTIGGSVAGTTSDTVNAPSVTSFGSLLSSVSTGVGAIVSSSGFVDANTSAPGNGGLVKAAGGSSALGAGGAGSNGVSGNGAAGGNATVTGTALSGGGGGGGGGARDQGSSSLTTAGNGGPGGFPGGGGGAGGNGFVSGTGGSSGPGLIALIEFLS